MGLLTYFFSKTQMGNKKSIASPRGECCCQYSQLFEIDQGKWKLLSYNKSTMVVELVSYLELHDEIGCQALRLLTRLCPKKILQKISTILVNVNSIDDPITFLYHPTNRGVGIVYPDSIYYLIPISISYIDTERFLRVIQDEPTNKRRSRSISSVIPRFR